MDTMTTINRNNFMVWLKSMDDGEFFKFVDWARPIITEEKRHRVYQSRYMRGVLYGSRE